MTVMPDQGAFPPHHTARLTLRRFTCADLDAFVAYRAAPDVARLQSWEGYTIQDGERFLRDQEAATFGAPDVWVQIAAEHRADRALAGDVATRVFDAGRQAELGMTFAPLYQGKGLASEAVAAIAAALFDRVGVHRIIGVTDAANAPAHALFARLGFRCEARHVQSAWFKGRWCDEWVFARLAQEHRAERGGPPAKA